MRSTPSPRGGVLEHEETWKEKATRLSLQLVDAERLADDLQAHNRVLTQALSRSDVEIEKLREQLQASRTHSKRLQGRFNARRPVESYASSELLSILGVRLGKFFSTAVDRIFSRRVEE